MPRDIPDRFKLGQRPPVWPPQVDLKPVTDRLTSAESRLLTAENDIDTLQVQVFGAWTFYTPSLTASVTNPTLGTGSVIQGLYRVIDDLVNLSFYVQFGTSGVNPGDGEYRLSLPSGFPASTGSLTAWFIGGGVAFDWSVAARRELFQVELFNSTTMKFHLKDATMFHNNPWTWAVDDRFGGSITYRT